MAIYTTLNTVKPLLSGHQLLGSLNFLPIFTVKRTCIIPEGVRLTFSNFQLWSVVLTFQSVDEILWCDHSTIPLQQ